MRAELAFPAIESVSKVDEEGPGGYCVDDRSFYAHTLTLSSSG